MDKNIDEIVDIKYNVIRCVHTGGSSGTFRQREEIVNTKKLSLKNAENQINKKLIELEKTTQLLKFL